MPAQPHQPAPGTQRVRTYFEGQADRYDRASRRGLWGFLRGLETPAVMKLAGVVKGERVLDAGSGTGHYTEALRNAGAVVTALDVEPRMLAGVKARLGVETIEGDLMTVRLEPLFDKVVCAGVLEFVQDPDAVIVNLAKGLRHDGPRQIIVLVAARSLGGLGYWLTRRTNGIDMHLFSRARLEQMAGAAGLRVQERVRAGYNWVVRMSVVGR